MRVREAASLLMMDGPEAFITPEQNDENTENVIDNWYLGPEEPSSDPDANCEYFDNSVHMMEKMEAIPYNDMDVNAGGRGYCTKFDFVCHNLRTCQAWEGEY
jgi:hypothetical protein